MQVSTKPRLKEEKSLYTLSTPLIHICRIRSLLSPYRIAKGEGFENRLMFVFLLLFLPFSSSLACLNFASERPNQVSHTSLLHTYLISRQQLWENAFPICSAVLKILPHFCSYFRKNHSERRFWWSLPLLGVQLWLWLWRVALGEAEGTERNNQGYSRIPWKALAGVAFLQKV